MILMNDNSMTQNTEFQTMTTTKKSHWFIWILAFQLPMLPAESAVTEQQNDKPLTSQHKEQAEWQSYQQKLGGFLQAFDAVKIQKANKIKEQLMPAMQREVQQLNQQIQDIKKQLKLASEVEDPEQTQESQQSLHEQLKALKQKNTRMSFIYKHLKAYQFQARNIKTAGVVRKDMLLEFAELMKSGQNGKESESNKP